MSNPDPHRKVALTRQAPGRFPAANDHGGEIAIGSGEGADFTPVEMTRPTTT
ncbi:MAG: hypothetical protein ACR2KG_07220 [Nocardioidaceae bacterium]